MEVAKDIQADARRLAPKRTGALAASIDAQADGDDALVGPTDAARSFNGPYGRAAELGGMRYAHNPSGRMWWHDGGSWHSAAANMMPSQPYLKPAVDLAVSSGRAERIYADHWRRAMDAG
jgi:hypothetical protein